LEGAILDIARPGWQGEEDAVTNHPKAATADPKEFFDNRFLKELQESGFVQEVYAKH
jgi:hypothetical protein